MTKITYGITFLLLTISLVANVYFFQQLQANDELVSTAQNEQFLFKQQYALLQQTLKRTQENLDAMKHPNRQIVSLMGKANINIYLNPVTQTTYIDANPLHAPPGDRQYQVWAKDTTNSTQANYYSLGVFNYQSDKDNLFRMKYKEGSTHFLVTLEKPGGSKQPNQQQIFCSN